MAFILLNEFIGDKIIDAAIPALYSGILVAGVFLYSVSLIALLVVFCFIIGALLYWRFVYRPASKAHSRRKAKLRRLKNSHQSPGRGYPRGSVTALKQTASRPKGGVCNYLKRVLFIMKHSVQHGITLLSYRQTRNAKQRAIEREWGGMNRATGLQGTVGKRRIIRPRSERIRQTDNPMSSPPSNWSDRYDNRSRKLSFPASITKMGSSMNILEHLHSERLKSPMKRSESIESYRESSKPSLPRSEDCKRQLVPLITFEVSHALAKMKARLSELEHCETERDGVVHEGQFETHEQHLRIEFQTMLEYFYPHGVALSPEEKKEAGELFDAWKTSQNLHFRVELSQDGVTELRMIRFSLFEEWFTNEILTIIHHSVADRLHDHSIRAAQKKRLTVITSFSPSSSWRASQSNRNSLRARSPSPTYSYARSVSDYQLGSSLRKSRRSSGADQIRNFSPDFRRTGSPNDRDRDHE
jgi:hypothetical protein